MSARDHLTESEIAAHCEQHLDWSGNLLRAAYGPEAADDAGIALFGALREFDPSRGVPLEAYLRKAIPQQAAGEYRKLNGRVGSAKRTARSSSVEVQDYDQPAESAPSERVDNQAMQTSSLYEVFRQLETIDDDAVRVTGLCAALSRWRVAPLGRAVRTDRATVRSRLDAVRASVRHH